MEYYYNPEVKLLLIPFSNEKVNIQYNEDPVKFQLPMIGPRPPFYANPRYEEYYPVI
ncbi:hypothetical protein [Fredinandcohnia quinoae]|uniref:Uncharacterized protein n=1 Tax=Fredinandcohnia quinoae TaxID=2918902 RepID=A0AAW5E5K4_9BACI|nr:hypothetical protein [Fredinandcohnia sp. SECRCQ15]MCH1624054.1 hypothetical protein [Fredinandcohnia sp. SECRCQ15]